MSSVMQIAFLLVALLAWSVKGHRDVAIQPQTAPSGQVRTYYIAADELDWDYAPSGIDQIHGEKYHFQDNPAPRACSIRTRRCIGRRSFVSTQTRRSPR